MSAEPYVSPDVPENESEQTLAPQEVAQPGRIGRAVDFIVSVTKAAFSDIID